jgi:hypothetical protein
MRTSYHSHGMFQIHRGQVHKNGGVVPSGAKETWRVLSNDCPDTGHWISIEDATTVDQIMLLHAEDAAALVVLLEAALARYHSNHR